MNFIIFGIAHTTTSTRLIHSVIAITLWINRVEVVVWAIPKIIKFTQPVAEYKEVVWPEGPSDPDLPLKDRK